jgi:hypothetical protein
MDGSPDIASLIGWDLSAIPAGSTILSAAIELTIANRSTAAYSILALDRAWEEFGAHVATSRSGGALGRRRRRRGG